VYYALFIFFDYYDFFGIKIKYFKYTNDTYMADEFGNRIRKEVPFPTMKYIADLQRDNTYSVIFGDSKSYSLNPMHIAKMVGNRSTTWLNLSFGGCTLEESIIEFYYTAQKVRLDKVIFELDYRALCPPVEMDRLSRLKNLDKWELYKCYFFDYYNNRMALSTLVSFLNTKRLNMDFDKKSNEKQELVKQMLKEQLIWAKDYNVNQVLIEGLINITKYCKNNNIEIIFYSPPINAILYNKVLSKSSVLEKMEKVKMTMSMYAPVYDMQFISGLSFREDDWLDVAHYTGNVCKTVEETLAGRNREYLHIYENGRLIK